MEIQRVVKGLGRVEKPLVSILMFAGGAVLALMMFLAATDVALRYIFNRPLPGTYELVEYMMAIIVPFGFVYCAHEKGHVGVDLLVERLPRKARLILGCITSFLTFGLFLLITWQNFSYIMEYYKSKQTSAVLLIPKYPFVAATSVAFAILTLVFLLDFFNLLSEGTKKWTRF